MVRVDKVVNGSLGETGELELPRVFSHQVLEN
jgi:hypothetical protein